MPELSLYEQQKQKMAGASMNGRGGGNWIKGEGVFTVEIISTVKKMGWNTSFTERDKELFIVEFKILTSTCDVHKPGTTASWTLLKPSDPKGGAGDIKAFCIAVTGTDPRSVKETDDKANAQATVLSLAAMGEADAFKELELPADFFVGQQVCLETKFTTSKKSGKDFTKHIWSPSAP